MQLLLLIVLMLTVSVSGSRNVRDVFYKPVDTRYAAPCFRLTNATHQIGCSASPTQTRGVLYYVDDMNDILELERNAPHAPYIVLMEPQFFRGDNEHVLKLKSMEPTVKGIIVRYDDNLTTIPESILSDFSPEKQCPNPHSGAEPNGCTNIWNPYGTDLLYTDFGEFPIFLVLTEKFNEIVECYNKYNNQSSGGYSDYPLCSIELKADMAVAVSTPTCFRRQNLPIPYLNGAIYCDALGDRSVWGSLYNLSSDTDTEGVIMLATKLDSVSFFPNVLSYGASSEVAAIATLLAVLEQLGKIKRNENNIQLRRPILYSFFHGESWDYIGSSRMAYDMKHNDAFPENKALPRITLSNISNFLELGQLGLIQNGTIYVHGDYSESELIQNLINTGDITVKKSSVQELPPASLQRFIREGVSEQFTGSVLTSFDAHYDNKFFGSRFDDINNFGNKSIDAVASDLSLVATAVAKAVFNMSGPTCHDCDIGEVIENIQADPETISDVLTCFLSNTSCDLFQSVFINSTAEWLAPVALSRYVTVRSQVNPETIIVQQLVAFFTANNASELDNPVDCRDCLARMRSGTRDKTVNITWMQYGHSKDQCLCVESFTYTHTAVSPVFDFDSIGYDSESYSTWTESVWSSINLRIYLVTYPLQEVGFFFLGLFMTAVTLLVSIQCTRKGRFIFEVRSSYVILTT